MRRIAFFCLFLLFILSLSFTQSDTQIKKTHIPLKTVKVGFFAFDGYHIMDENENRSGYGFEYLQHLMLYANWQYEYSGYEENWGQMQEMLANGKIDILTSAQKTPEREERFDFSDLPIGYSSTILTVKSGETRYLTSDYDSFNGMRVGMLRSNSRNESFEHFAKEHQFEYTPVYFSDTDEMLAQLQSGKVIDAIVTSNLRAIQNEWILAQFDTSPFYVMVRKGSPLLAEVNAAIRELDVCEPLLKDELFRKYYSPDTGSGIAYSMEERRFIKECTDSHTVFKALINVDRKPYSYVENGVLCGVFSDITQEIIKRTALNVEIIIPANRKEYLEQVSNPEISLILDMHSDYNIAEALEYKLTRSYIAVPFYQVTRKSNAATLESVESNNAINDAGAYLPSFSVIGNFQENQKKSYKYKSIEESIQAVRNGTEKSCYIFELAALQVLYNDSRDILRIQPSSLPKQNFHIGVNAHENTLLASIFNKASASINDDFISNIVHTYGQYKPQPVSLKLFLSTNEFVLPVVIGVFCLFGCIIGFSRFQRNAEYEKNYELNRFLSFVCRANDVVEEVDIAGGRKYTYIDNENGITKREDFYSNLELDADTVHPDDWPTVKDIFSTQKLQELIMHAQQHYCECRLKQANGSWLWFSLIVQGLLPDKQHPCSYMLFRRNITEAKQTELQKHQAVIEAYNVSEKATATKVSFLSQMSHEIRTPLNAITGYISIARDSQNDAEAVCSCLDKIDVSAEHLLGIINDYLEMSAMATNKIKINAAIFNIQEFLEKTQATMSAQAKLKNLEFTIHTEKLTHKRFIGDEMRLSQILINLLSNAIKFTPSCGFVTVTVSEYAMSATMSQLCFEVTDTGIGMSEEFMKRMFEPFEQEASLIQQMYHGSGLGLSITKNLVTLMGGSISVKSELGKGSIFTVEVPLQLENENEATVPYEKQDIPLSAFNFTDCHVLVAEDNEMNMEIIVKILQKAGFIVDSVSNGMAAVEVFEHSEIGTYQAILMDIQMPVMDGYEATRRIRALARKDAESVQIIAMTANAFAEDIAAALAAGMNSHAAKPINIGKLYYTLGECLNRLPDEKRLPS